jgi:lambda family phage portal protein
LYRTYGSILISDESYRSIEQRKLDGWRFPVDQTADEALLPALHTLQAASSDQIRNDALAGAAINSMTTGVISQGLRPQPALDERVLGISEDKAHGISSQMESLFQFWANQKCDFAESMSFWDLENLVFRSSLEFGDVFVVKRQGRDGISRLRLQPIEASRVKTPMEKSCDPWVKSGIQFHKKTGEALAYYVGNSDIQDFSFIRIPTFDQNGERQVASLINRKRIGQSRGVPYLANITGVLKELSRYIKAETEAAVLNSYVAFVTKTKGGTNPLPHFGVVKQKKDSQREIPTKISPNTNIHLLEGEDISMLDPSRPNPNSSEFIKSQMRILAAELEQPLEVILGSFDRSYSASRAALVKAHQVYKIRRKWLVHSFHSQVWEWLITDAVNSGALDLPGFYESSLKRSAYLQCSWIGDSCLQIDLSKEVNGYKELLEMGLISKKMVTQILTGENYDRVKTHIRKEKEMDDE